MKTTLLVVEDDEAILHLIDVALTMNYYKVVTAKTGKKRTFAKNRTTRYYLIRFRLTRY